MITADLKDYILIGKRFLKSTQMNTFYSTILKYQFHQTTLDQIAHFSHNDVQDFLFDLFKIYASQRR